MTRFLVAFCIGFLFGVNYCAEPSLRPYRRFFMQGSAPKGVLNFKGENFTPDMLEGFKRQWRANLAQMPPTVSTPNE